MRPISDGGDAEAQKKMESLEENLKEKEEDLESLEELNQALIVKEKKASDELQDARKELISVSFLAVLPFYLHVIIN